MTRDSELEELEQLYRSVVPDVREGAPEEVTAKVKYAAEAHINRVGSRKVVSIGEYRRTKAFWSGIGLAAGITLGVYLGTLGESQVYPSDGAPGMVFMGDKVAVEAAKLDRKNVSRFNDQILLSELPRLQAKPQFTQVAPLSAETYESFSQSVKSIEDSRPDEWQRRIAEHALLGEMQMVESLSKEFNRRFPDYGKQPGDNDK